MAISLSNDQAAELRHLIQCIDDPDDAATEGDKPYTSDNGAAALKIIDDAVNEAEGIAEERDELEVLLAKFIKKTRQRLKSKTVDYRLVIACPDDKFEDRVSLEMFNVGHKEWHTISRFHTMANAVAFLEFAILPENSPIKKARREESRKTIAALY